MINTKFLYSHCFNMLKCDFYTICLVDCKWDNWSEWEDCSKSCGGGVQIASRGKLQEDLFGGKPCDSESTRQRNCNSGQCPSMYLFYK